MKHSGLLWRGLVAASAVMLSLTLSFAIANAIPAKAENGGGEVKLTFYADVGGKVTVNGGDVADGSSGTSVTKTYYKADGASFELKATPDDGYIFAYWYKEEGTPLTDLWSGTSDKCSAFSDDINIRLTKSDDYSTFHARFIKKDDAVNFIPASAWTQESGSDQIVLKSPDTYNFTTGQALPFVFEFIGEKWIDFNMQVKITKSSDEVNDPLNNGFLNHVYIDGVSLSDSSVTFNSATTVTSALYKASGDGFHRIEFDYVAPYFNTEKPAPKSLEVTFNYTFKDEQAIRQEKGTVVRSIDFISRLGDVYYLEGLGGDKFYNVNYFIKHGTKIEPDVSNHAQVTFPQNVPIVFYAIEKDKVASTLDPEQQTTVYNGGIGINEATKGTYKFKHIFTDIEETVVADFKEVAILPKVTVTKTVNNNGQEPEEIENGGALKFNYVDTNSLLVKIASHPQQKQVDFAITANGQEKQYESYGAEYGFTLNGINEVNHVSIMPNYGEEYYPSEAFTFDIKVEIAEMWQNFISSSSDNVEVVPDTTYPWYLDPAYNDGDEAYAYSSGLTGLTGTGNGLSFPVSQLGFKVKGDGLFTMEFYPDEGTSATNIGYKLNSKIEPKPGNSQFDLGSLNNHPSKEPFEGFKETVATDIWLQKGIWHKETSSYTYEPVLGNGVTVIDGQDGWYKFQLSVDAVEENGESIIFIAQAIVSNASGSKEGSRLTLRNVAFYSGNAYATWETEGAGAESEYTVKQGEAPASKGKLSPGTALTFTANPTGGHTFYGWKLIKGTLKGGKDLSAEGVEIADSDIDWDTQNAQFVSFEPTYRYTVGTGCSKIVAVIDNEGTYAVRNGSKLYAPENVQSALDAAGDGKDKNVIVVDNVVGEKAVSDITVPAGVNFILPFDVKGNYYKMGEKSQTKVSWEEGSGYEKPVYTLTLKGRNTVNGNFYVGGVLHSTDQSAQGHTSGAYSQLILNGTLTVGEGGLMDVCGRVTGEGSITVQSGGVLYQPFMILDYSGGTNTEAMFTAGVTPFKMYAMINIQCKGGYTIEYGGELFGHASLFFWSAITTLDTQFISYEGTVRVNGEDKKGTTTLINLIKGSSAKCVYDDAHGRPAGVLNIESVGKTTITIDGGAKAGFMNFLDMVQTDGVAFSLPYNYELVLENGEYEMAYSYKIMPGAVLKIGENATLTVKYNPDVHYNDIRNVADNNVSLYVYDSFFIPNVERRTYPTGEQLSAAGYNPYASLIVDGKLVLEDKTTFVGTVQTTNADGTAQITVGKNVTLSANLFDGVATEYSCNYTEYTLNARIWVKTGADTGELHALEAGTTYVSTSAEKFTLTGIEFKYCNGGKFGDEKHPLEGGHNFNEQTKTTADVSATAENALNGAWMIKHGEEHVFDWTPDDGEKPTAEDPVKTLTRECHVLGCTHKGSAYLLYKFDAITSQEYKGAAFSTEELVGLFKAMYKDKFPEGAEATVSFGTVAEVKNATTYTVTVGLTGASFLIGDALVSEGTFSFTVTPKAVSVKISDQSADYSGNEPNVSQTAFTFTDGEPFEGDTLGFVITKAQGKDCKAGGYEITAEESKGSQFANGNYTITITYTAEGHSVFTINKVTLKVTPDNFSSPEGEEPIGTFTAKISGFVNDADKEALEAGILAALRYTCGVTKESEQGTYDITVAYSGTLDNYDVDCSAKGRYTVTDPLFGGVGFKNTDAVTYDGNAHALEVTGHEALTNAKVVITYQKDGKPVEAENVKDAGEYEVTAVISAEGENGQTYTQTLEATLTIEKLDVHVTLLAQSKTYDGAPASPDSGKDVGWKFTAEAFKLCGEDGTDVLGIRLSVEGGNKNAGKYTILTEKNENGNYNVIFDNDGKGLYSIEKKAVAVTIKDIGTTYGDGATKEAHAGDYEYDKSLIVSGDTVTVTLNFEGVDLSKANAAGYPVTASAAANNDNYTFTFTEGAKWTVAAKPVTVNVAKKTVTYSDTASPEAPTAWSLAEGSSLVAGDDLGVHLSKDGTGKDAGNYAIVATWDNKNYAVTFTGLTVEDNGGYVIEKLDISDDVFFFWEPDGSVTPDGTTTLRVKFAGQTVTLHCVGSYVDGNETLHGNLTATLDKPTVDALGTFTVTATIEDKNYSGSKAFTVIVTNAEGYTQELIEKLQRLGELAEGISADDLKAENFADLKEINGILNGLTEEEKEAAAKTLEEYEALVEAWEELADTDDIVETAKEIADAPIAAMFGAAAMLTALAGLAYIALKGGIL